MSEAIDVKTIVSDYLRKNGADGLCNNLHECGCGIDNLMECEYFCTYCRPAAAVRCPDCGGTVYVPLGKAWQKYATA